MVANDSTLYANFSHVCTGCGHLYQVQSRECYVCNGINTIIEMPEPVKVPQPDIPF